MSSASSSSDTEYRGIAGADLGKLKEKRKEIGDDRKFRRMCDSETECLGYNVLHVAAGMCDFDKCKFLVDEVGVDIDVQTDMGDTPLILALKTGLWPVDIAKYLIEHGAEITTAGYMGFTALHWAAVNGCIVDFSENEELLILLLEKGADIYADSVCGTPLHLAAKFGIPDVVNFLLENNAEPDSVSKYRGISPLINAIYSDTNTLECVELLLKAGADSNKFVNGLSPLAHAVKVKSNDCINSLIAAEADVHAVSSFGLRPIEHAAIVDNVEAIDILIAARPTIIFTPNWSFVNMMNSVNSVEAKQRRGLYIRNLKQNGDDAFDQQDYSSAITFYTEAIYHNQSDEIVLANRSFCWARIGEGVFASRDGELCVELKPDWAEAHLREAAAWHLLKRYRMSADAFKRAFELALENEELEISATRKTE